MNDKEFIEWIINRFIYVFDEDENNDYIYRLNIIADKLDLNDTDYINLKISRNDVQELFEILCDIPFEITMIDDESPRTTRHSAVEFLIDQLAPYYDMGEFT